MPFKYQPQRLYYPRRATPQDGGDFERGWQIGSQIGKGLSGLAGAIQDARQNAVANQLMNTQNPPRAALVSPGYSPGGDTTDPNADLSTDLPQDVSPVIGGTDTGDMTPNVIPAGVPTYGTAPATGGIAEMKLRQEAAKEQLNQQNIQSEIAKRQAAANLANIRTGLAARGTQPQGGNASAWSGYGQSQGQPTAKGKTVAPTGPLNTTPLTDFSQLQQHINGMYGKGTYESIVNNLDSADTTTNPGYVTFADSKGNQQKIPSSEFGIYQKQYNALRISKGLPPVYGKGQDATVGDSATNPIPITNDLDAATVPPGKYFRRPDGQIGQRPAMQ